MISSSISMTRIMQTAAASSRQKSSWQHQHDKNHAISSIIITTEIILTASAVT